MLEILIGFVIIVGFLGSLYLLSYLDDLASSYLGVSPFVCLFIAATITGLSFAIGEVVLSYQ